MISLADLSLYLNKLMFFDPKLDVEKVDPYMTNGLMIKGSDQIENIGFVGKFSVAFT